MDTRTKLKNHLIHVAIVVDVIIVIAFLFAVKNKVFMIDSFWLGLLCIVALIGGADMIIYAYYVLCLMFSPKITAEIAAEAAKERERLEKEKKRLAGIAEYRGTTLILRKRCSEVGQMVKMEEERDYYLSTTPTKTIFTSVTVGGVTTGGFDTVGGKTAATGGGRIGKYKLTYSGGLINKIKLNNDLYNEALDSPVQEYLDRKDMSITVNIPVALPGYMVSGMSRMSIQEKQNIILSEGRKGFPTYEKANAIYKWIRGN